MKTFSMRVYIGAYVALIALTLYELATFFVPNPPDTDGGIILASFAFILALLALPTAAAMWWRSAPRRASFWPVAMLPGLAIYLVNVFFFLFGGFTTLVPGFPLELCVTVAAIILIVAGVAATRDARRGTPPVAVQRGPWTRVAVVAILAAMLGAIATSVGAASAPGATVAGVPNRTAILTAKDKQYQSSLETQAGQDLGLFIVNQDPVNHSFDINALNIHVRVPAKSVVAVVVTAPTPGTIQYYCFYHVGMVGQLTVR
jgi:plastocyanin